MTHPSISVPLRTHQLRLPEAQEILFVTVGVSQVVLYPDLEGRQGDLFGKPPGGHLHHAHVRNLAWVAAFMGGSLCEEINLVRTEEEQKVGHLGRAVVQVLGPEDLVFLITQARPPGSGWSGGPLPPDSARSGRARWEHGLGNV